MTTWIGNTVIELDGYINRSTGRDRKQVEARGKGARETNPQTPFEGNVREADRIQLRPGEYIKLKLKDVTGVFYRLWLYRESQGKEDEPKTGELHEFPIDGPVNRVILDGDVRLLADGNSITIKHRDSENDPRDVHAHYRFSVFFEIDNIRYVWDPDVHDMGQTGRS